MSEPSFSSGLKSADAAICTTPCYLMGVALLADGTNAASIIVYDHATAASGTAIAKLKAKATDTQAVDSNIPGDGVYCANGIYADVTGTGAEYIVYFRKC